MTSLQDEPADEWDDDRFRSLFRHHPHGVFGLDRAGRVVEANAAAEEMSGYPEAQLLGLGLADLVDPDDLTTAEEAFARVLGRESQQVDLRIRTCRGRSVEVAVTAIPWVDADGVRGAVGIAEDVTQRNQTARDLEVTRSMAVAASEAKSAFVARMSHEVKTPLTSILATVELLRGTDDVAERGELLELLQRSGQRLLRLVDGVLDFGSAGASDVQVEEFDLHSLVRDVAALAARTAERKGLEVRLLLHDDVPVQVRDRPTWTNQILTNLLGNAVEHTDAGHVELAVSAVRSVTSGHLVMYRVTDTGAGIARDQQARIFDAFTTGPQPPAAGEPRHTGLGLSIVKQLVAVGGGSMALDSVVGRGSTFTVVMPVQPVTDGVLPAES